MNTRSLRRSALVISASIVVMLLSVTALADVPATPQPDTTGVAHHWVVERMKYAPYTELTTVERSAMSAAKAALVAPPPGLVRQADHGYVEAKQLIAIAKSLNVADPIIVGHELLVWNDGTAARMYVDTDGLVKLLEVGPIQKLLVSKATAVADQGDRDAAEIAKAAFDVAAGLDPKVSPAATVNGLVVAHGVGFAKEDGTHVVVRADLHGNTSYPDW